MTPITSHGWLQHHSRACTPEGPLRRSATSPADPITQMTVGITSFKSSNRDELNSNSPYRDRIRTVGHVRTSCGASAITRTNFIMAFWNDSGRRCQRHREAFGLPERDRCKISMIVSHDLNSGRPLEPTTTTLSCNTNLLSPLLTYIIRNRARLSGKI
jgi:hypothetical protein